MIGLSTYAFFWQHQAAPLGMPGAEAPLSLSQMLDRSHALGAEVFQICDYLPLLGYSAAELTALKAQAGEQGVTLELGTRGVGADHLATYLSLAGQLGASMVRSMLNTADHKPTLTEAQSLLEATLPSYADSGITLALETYEQVSTTDLVSLIEAVGHDNLGICLDPANSVAALEDPIDVIDRTAVYVKNIHVKDFQFTRRGGWVGFTLEGAPLGTGLLDYDHLIATVKPGERGINQIIEHWLPWGDSFEATVQLENQWNTHNIDYLRSKES